MSIKRFLPWIVFALIALIFQESCKKQETHYEQPFLTFSFPRMERKHDLYYRIDYQARSIEIVFNENLDPATITASISLRDLFSPLDGKYDIDVSGAVIWLLFHPDFHLKDGWLYSLTLTTGIRSVSGHQLQSSETLELRSTARPFGLPDGSPGQDTLPANSIAVISDIHMGDERATTGHYCWFGENKEALESFLDLVKVDGAIKQLVIQGDLFDEWIIPFDSKPFDPDQGVHNSREYFASIATSSTNLGILEKLRSIAADPEIELIYIPGNHDMLMTQEILDSIIPGVIWQGDVTGLGKYNPVPEIIMEHGHRYDFFNCPQPLVNPGHMLPPGYFISRMDAYALASQTGRFLKGEAERTGDVTFLTAWTLAMGYIFIDYSIPPPPMDSANILMTGIDGYPGPLSFNGTRDMYAANIEELWMNTQTTNGVPVPLSLLVAMWTSLDLTTAAILEYMQQSQHLASYKVISFGHSHNPLLEVFPTGEDYTNIYANSGSWVDADQCKHKVRTFLVITPGEWTGSALDVVRLYQYDPEIGSDTTGSGYAPVLLAEENI